MAPRLSPGRHRLVIAEVRYVLMDIHDVGPRPSAQVVHEAGGWSAFIPGLPIAADGATSEEAIDELVDAIREYAEDWHDRLRHAPNHRESWRMVQLVDLSEDDELRAWLRAAPQ
jgi:predicted RNase H-like HicB family nuclease